MSDDTIEARVGAALGGLADLFGAVCGDPDNPEVTQRADQALHDLDALLSGAA